MIRSVRLKAIQLNAQLETLVHAEVKFDTDLPEFRTSGGVNHVAFAVVRTPIWMDNSTGKQCIEMEEAIGGRHVMVERTGSKCYARFTGPQIRKLYQTKSDGYKNTQRISLVSSFLASLFLGDIAPIDFSDASGMNLFDINERRWSELCLNACAPDLEEKLGEPVPTSTVIGNVGSFFVQRYGIPSDCKIIAFTGDNPSALAGLVIGSEWLAISLGTSDTIMMGLKKPPHLDEGHVLMHPTDDGYMGLLCFRNGSLVRDIFKRAEANNSWDYFSELLESTPRGNFGNMALHFQTKEIIPACKGVLRWNKLSSSDSEISMKGVSKFGSPQTEVRALIEGQMLHRKAVATDMGFNFGEKTRILATGGASNNKSILQVLADVFNASVYTQKTAEAALHGAAFRAAYGHYMMTKAATINRSDDENNKILSYHDFVLNFVSKNTQKMCEPSKDAFEIYEPMIARYREMVEVLLKIQDQDGH
uniref:Xylulose kinase n=1 Tax=Culicoides sonorensis TaxID=179676 RepID=A0A336MTQ5_CULSO